LRRRGGRGRKDSFVGVSLSADRQAHSDIPGVKTPGYGLFVGERYSSLAVLISLATVRQAHSDEQHSDERLLYTR